MRQFLVAAITAALSLPSLTAAVPVPTGSEFQIHTYTTGQQVFPDVAMDASGRFIAAWEGGKPPIGSGILGRRFDRLGNPLGGEFYVNQHTRGGKILPRVIADAAGNFVVVWEDFVQDGSSSGIFGRRFDSQGTAQAADFRINTYTLSAQQLPAIAADPLGNFVVVWQSTNQNVPFGHVFGQRFDSLGNRVGAEFQVTTNGFDTTAHSYPSVGMSATDAFVVVWNRRAQGSSVEDIFGQRFDASGMAQGSEFLVNNYTFGGQWRSQVAMDDAGNFVVVWRGGTTQFDVFSRRFDSLGVPQGGEFMVNTFTSFSQYDPAIGMDRRGDFLVTWRSPQDGSFSGIFAQSFDALGNPEGSEFQVNTYFTSIQLRPRLAAPGTGDLVIVWESVDQDGSGGGIFGQRFAFCTLGDGDQDGICDNADNCLGLHNSMQEDEDGDGAGDGCDVCPSVPDPDQLDFDQDGWGDLCDNCPEGIDPSQADADGDGAGDVCDLCPDDPDPGQADADEDGAGDACDLCPSTALSTMVDTGGCSMEQRCPCDDSAPARAWPSRNRGEHMRCMARTLREFVRLGLLDRADLGQALSEAGSIPCGEPPTSPRPPGITSDRRTVSPD